MNTVIIFANLSFSFPVGLGISSLGAAFLTVQGGDYTTLLHVLGGILFAFSLGIMACLWICRSQARKGKVWPYVLGLCVYAFDALVTLLIKDWIGFAFHAWGLYSIWLGYTACKALGQLGEPGSESLEGPLGEPAPIEP
ncbi:MAG TPA: hypothetical protein VJ623_12830 [Holophagaceae bacterium]|nr:hypothetical protein [Holophagaceae bacterium]